MAVSEGSGSGLLGLLCWQTGASTKHLMPAVSNCSRRRSKMTWGSVFRYFENVVADGVVGIVGIVGIVESWNRGEPLRFGDALRMEPRQGFVFSRCFEVSNIFQFRILEPSSILILSVLSSSGFRCARPWLPTGLRPCRSPLWKKARQKVPTRMARMCVPQADNIGVHSYFEFSWFLQA